MQSIMKKRKIFFEEHKNGRMKLISIRKYYFCSSVYYLFYLFYQFSTSLKTPATLMKSFKAIFYPSKLYWTANTSLIMIASTLT